MSFWRILDVYVSGDYTRTVVLLVENKAHGGFEVVYVSGDYSYSTFLLFVAKQGFFENGL